MHFTWVNEFKQYSQADKKEIQNTNIKERESDILTGEDKYYQFSLIPSYPLKNVTITVQKEEGLITEIGQIKSTAAYDRMPKQVSRIDGEVPTGHRKEANEIMVDDVPKDLMEDTLYNFYVKVRVAEAGVPHRLAFKLVLSADNLNQPLSLTADFNVIPWTIKNDDFEGFDIELWQNPFAHATYYKENLFSKKHTDLLKTHLLYYKELYGDALTASLVDDPWGGQTYNASKPRFPSMVKWEKDHDWHFDFSILDQWIKIGCDNGIGLHKISVFGVIPWHQKITYRDRLLNKDGVIDINDDELYKKAMGACLEALIQHAEDNDWFDKLYIGIDEQGISKERIDWIKSFKNKQGEGLKIAAAIDHLKQYESILFDIDDLTVGSMAIKTDLDYFKQVIQKRNQLNLKTTVYSCTGHIPGNFSLSMPAESYWTVWFAKAVGGHGFLRWAYDSWVENPLIDSSHRLFEAGDCFLVYPREKNKPIKNHSYYPSTRSEMFRRAIYQIRALEQLLIEEPEKTLEIIDLLSQIHSHYTNNGIYLDELGKKSIISDMTQFEKSFYQLFK